MKKVIFGKHLFNGKSKIDDFFLLFEDNRILEVGSRSQYTPSDDTQILESDCCTVIPGLIDTHIHIFMDPRRDFSDYMGNGHNLMEFGCIAAQNARLLLEQGIVCACDVGSPSTTGMELRELIRKGVVFGPELRTSGEGICITGGHGWILSKECDGADEVAKGVRQQIRAGADCIKLMVSSDISSPGPEKAPCEMEFEEISAGVREAHKKGRKVRVHTHGNTAIRQSVEAGVDSIEHGTFSDNKILQEMLKRGTYLVPTLSAPYFATKVGLARDPNNSNHLESAKIIQQHRSIAKTAFDMGVTLAMGTDKGTPGNNYEDALSELIFLCESGISPQDVLTISTINSAQLMDVDQDYGTLEPGKMASFIILDKNPMEDIQNIYGPHTVFHKGQQVYSSR